MLAIGGDFRCNIGHLGSGLLCLHRCFCGVLVPRWLGLLVLGIGLFLLGLFRKNMTFSRVVSDFFATMAKVRYKLGCFEASSLEWILVATRSLPFGGATSLAMVICKSSSESSMSSLLPIEDEASYSLPKDDFLLLGPRHIAGDEQLELTVASNL
ncbi:ornithine aminotransferase [Striga asiatica]|uniref:Ornithine aminotransferase n=1 Tax=Striga asiatica TaxID=4170 RepID=A0A5A7PA60_STRAF|nr:ornithine aminotransferase [Striga asiatica]